MTERYHHGELLDCTRALFEKAGLAPEIAAAVAEILLEADMLGYDTHGLLFVPPYLAALEKGETTTGGVPETVKDHGHALLLEGRGLPGQFAMTWALEQAFARLSAPGAPATLTVVLGGCRNISCLATYARRAALRGHMCLVAASAPGSAVVAPHGGREGRLSTNPLAVGIPTTGHPILIDTSTSATSNRQIERHQRAGTQLPLPSLVDADGQPSTDPAAFFGKPRGAILPGGGVDYGHKGFALSLMVEALTSGLLGVGRNMLAQNGNAGIGNHVFMQLFNAEAFGGLAPLATEMTHLAASCRASAPMHPARPVRVPGDRAQRLFEEGMAQGVTLHPEIMPRMAPLLEKFGVPVPQPV